MKHPMSYSETTVPVTPDHVSRYLINEFILWQDEQEFFGFIRSIQRLSATITPMTPWS